MYKSILYTVSLVMVLWGCVGNSGSKVDPDKYDTPKKGTIRISVDESFKPIIDSQIKVYEASFPETKIIAEYKSEAECLRDLENDSIRMVIVTRGLSRQEVDGFKEKIKFKPLYGLLAYDAIAVVLNRNAKNEFLALKDLRSMLDGTIGGDYEVVMDGLTATSTVRYALDSILKGKPLGQKVVAAKNSEEVLKYVESNPKAIGLVGVSWVGNRNDDEQLSFNNQVKLASMLCETCDKETYVLPYQANIALGRYPLIRGIYFILKENFNGLGTGFMNFMTGERGQLIFKRAYLLPGRMRFEVRNMSVAN
jgi:phosphate transport system substrate-binding protein